MSAARRNGTIDVLKLVFMVLVMCMHTGRIIRGGYIAVEFFFIVSGYLMAQSMSRATDTCDKLGSETIAFIFHKAASIFPYYLVAWLLSFTITAVVDAYTADQTIWQIILSPYNLFMVQMAGFFDLGHRVQGAWYISAMLLAMFVIYPIRRRNRDLFDYYLAPLVLLFFVGYCYQTTGGVTQTLLHDYDATLHVYNGLLRAIAEICAGIICYNACQRLTSLRPSGPRRAMLTLLETFGYAATIVFACLNPQGPYCIALIFWLMVSVTISFSGLTVYAKIFTGSWCRWLGKFSLMLYLTHEIAKNKILRPMGVHTLPLEQYLPQYFALSIDFALFVLVVGNLLLWWRRARRD